MAYKRDGSFNITGEDLYKNMKVVSKKYVRIREGAELYSIGINTFRRLAEEAKAVYKIDGIVLVNLEIFEKYLEVFRVWR